MSFTILKKNPTQGEITSSLTGSTGDGAGLHFNGSGYVSAGDTTVIDGATKLSVEVIAATTAADNGEMVAKAHDATALRFYINTSGQVVFRVNNGSGNGTATSSGTVIDGNPTHIVGVWDGSTVKIYINGNEDGSAALSGGAVPNVTDQLALGAQQSSGGGTANKFTGTLYRARLFNYAVDAKSLFENGASVDFADQYGSQTKLIDSDFNGSFDGWNTSNDWATQTNNSNAMQLVANAANQICRTGTQLTKGKRYRVTYTASGVTGSPGFSTAAATHVVAGVISAGTANSFEFTFPTSATSQYFYIKSNASGDAATLDDISVVQIGAAVDLDLAFASPTQSLTVQDRAGLADGTCSASGVTQVQPVVQLNSTSARIGTTAATPADNSILVSDLVQAERLIAKKSTGSGNTEIKIENDSASNAAVLTLEGKRTSDNDCAQILIANSGENVAAIKGFRSGANDAGKLEIQTSASGSSGLTTRLTIDSIGHVAIGDDKYYQWGGTNARIVGSHAGNYVKILTGNSAKLTVDSTGLATFSNGIALQTSPSNDSATANEAYTLDKYETGTFQLADGSGASLTITGGLGRYTRIGDRVFISVQFGMPSVTNGNHMTLEGLPFNTANNDASRGLIISYSGSANVAYSLTTANTDKVSFYTSAGVNASNTNASGASFWLNGHYRTA